MSEHELLRPIRTAVFNLLLRLSDALAVQDRESDSDGSRADPRQRMAGTREVARCFFLTGERGSGKTTALLSAQSLCANGGGERDRQPTSGPTCNVADQEANHVVERLHGRVHWLDVIDLEPMPPKGNVLTTLLVAVRAALEPTRDNPRRRAGLLEELSGDLTAKLERLIDDSALVWQEIAEQDTRERAHRQVASAERYMSFGRELTELLALVGQALAARLPRPTGPLTLVLPIDNIDRSSEHLRSVFKLAQLVTCPHLFLVLAGDHRELNDLLTLSYWTELGPNRSERSTAGELVIARRQAAATVSKVLPPNHRVEIKLLSTADVLEFKLAGGQPLSKLLTQLSLETKNNTKLSTLLASTEAAPTEIGKWALQLTARGAIDLWLLVRAQVDWMSKRGADPTGGAASVARKVVRHLTAESSLPHWAARRIQRQVIRRVPDGRDDNGPDGCARPKLTQIVLGTSDQPEGVKVKRVRSAVASYPAALDTPGALQFVDLELFAAHEFVVELRDGARSAQLPSTLGAWFLVLFDVLMYSPHPLVIRPPEGLVDSAGPSVTARWRGWHDGNGFAMDLRWPCPKWGSFYEHTLMNREWRALKRKNTQSDSDEVMLPTPPESQRDLWCKHVRRWLAVCWIEVVLDLAEPNPRLSSPHRDRLEKLDPENFKPFLDGVVARADDAIERTRSSALSPQTSVATISQAALHDWLLHELPRFFTGELATGLSFSEAGSTLCKHWGDKAVAVRTVDRRRRALRKALDHAPSTNQAGDNELFERVAAELDHLIDDPASPLRLTPLRS